MSFLVSDYSFVQFAKRQYRDILGDPKACVQIYNPNTTCSALDLMESSCCNIVIVCPNDMFYTAMNSLMLNYKHTIAKVSKLFENDTEEHYASIVKTFLITRNPVAGLFLILHKCGTDYAKAHHARKFMDVDAELKNLERVYKSGVAYTEASHVHSIFNTSRCECWEVGTTHADLRWVIFTKDSGFAQDMETLKNIKHSRVIQTGTVLDTLDYCDKWDIDALSAFENIDIETLTIDGKALDEKKHPCLSEEIGRAHV